MFIFVHVLPRLGVSRWRTVYGRMRSDICFFVTMVVTI